MKHLSEKRINLILLLVIIVLCVAIAIPIITTTCQVSTDEGMLEETTRVTAAATEATTAAATETTEVKVFPHEVKVKAKSVKTSDSSSDTKKVIKKSENTTSKSRSASKSSEKSEKSAKATEATETIQYATATPAEHKASYTEQWNKGYLVAIDNPDKSYSCAHIDLTDENRRVLEHLCMGELGSGGFTGAALIAQAVKNAMASYGIDDVKTVIKQFHYTGKLKNNPTKAVKDAVIYIFDMDKNAVQHRILYMYNPYLVQSAFHESQNYICTFADIRFFDNK